MGATTSVTEARNAIRMALNAGTSPGGLPAALIREHETLKLYFYEPRFEDRQEARIFRVADGDHDVA